MTAFNDLIATSLATSVALTTGITLPRQENTPINNIIPMIYSSSFSPIFSINAYSLPSSLLTINDVKSKLISSFKYMKDNNIISYFKIWYIKDEDSLGVKLISTNENNENYLYDFFENQPNIVNSRVIAFIS